MTATPIDQAQVSESSFEVLLLKQLIRCQSVTPADAGCQEILAAALEKIGFACEPMPFGNVANLWARRGISSPLFCFAGHTDVVPPGPADSWHSAPFDPSIRDGILYGRGAADMKGSLAAMVAALSRFVARNPDHPGSIAVLLTSDEEGLAIDGTARVIDELNNRGERIDWCVVGEPSSKNFLGDTVRIGRRGSLSGSLRVRGVQGHVAYPHLAKNPIREFAPVMAQLNEINWDNGNRHFPPTTFEMVEVHSSAKAANVIPAELSAQFNLRYSPESDQISINETVRAVLDRHNLDYELDWRLYGEPFLTQPGKLSEATSRAIFDSTGHKPDLSTGGGTSDGRFIAPTGAEVIEFGPINASIHQANEHIMVRDLSALCRIYERIVELLLQ